MSNSRRSHEVDVIRMAALIGICIVNVPFMALPEEFSFVPPDNFLDHSAAFIVACFLQFKCFLLFSFIFGWGMAIQSKSALSNGASVSSRYFRRMGGLAILGVFHALLVFSGDILFLYALLGVVLWMIKDFSPRRLLTFAVCMMLVSMFVLFITGILLDAAMMEQNTTAFEKTSPNLGGTFLEATEIRVYDWPVTFVALVFLQGPLALGAFACGLAAAKTDFFSENSDGLIFIQKRFWLLIIIAIPTNILYAAAVSNVFPDSNGILLLFGLVGIAIGAPAFSLIYLYFIIHISRKINIPHLLVLSGRNSLSSYVGQGVLAGFVFGTYGLGLFDKIGLAALIPMSIVIALLAMTFVGAYAKYFGRGPLEPILRKITGS
ncbi:DUF418 domain-containing protein [Alteromonas sp. KUL49]|uniref:DUF418 domain-containing protein n=1 Tax=Alteromonas sp. KUL49 TaxID=2480798 RepID=UPI00102F0742|nr:DUF418 domain-containing protein [Alteromonas sp. KUL49]TAP41285.1 DUF418 domain-containing protein [Alteromonas sp. KUL49]GEA10343.1 hypothetical protein KUL49_07180 [Alteromonas sp. KUL49]